MAHCIISVWKKFGSTDYLWKRLKHDMAPITPLDRFDSSMARIIIYISHSAVSLLFGNKISCRICVNKWFYISEATVKYFMFLVMYTVYIIIDYISMPFAYSYKPFIVFGFVQTGLDQPSSSFLTGIKCQIAKS